MKDMANLQIRMEKAFATKDMVEFNEKVSRALKGGGEDFTGVTVSLVMELTKDVINNFDSYYPQQAKTEHKRLANLLGPELLGNIVGYQLVNAASNNMVRYRAVRDTAELIGDVVIELMLKEHEDEEIRRAAKSIKVKYGAKYIKAALARLKEKADLDIEDSMMMVQFTQNIMGKVMERSGLFVFGEAMDDDNEDILTTISFNEKALDKLGVTAEKLAEESVQFRPLVAPPKDWTSVREGGYHTDSFSMPLVNARGTRKEIAEYEERLNNDERFKRFMNAVNVAQRTPFKVNQAAYKLAHKVYMSGEALLDIPSYKTTQPDDERICKLYDEMLAASKAGAPQEELQKYHKAIQMTKVEAYKKDISRNSKREACRRIIKTAGKFRMFDEIFFAYQADFRGRIYNVCPTLSTQGSDLAKGLLVFKNGKALGEDGYFWLCVHAANVYGGTESLDKQSFINRVAFIENNAELVKTVAKGDIEDPQFLEIMEHAENPIMFFAVCCELAKLSDMSKEEREAFISFIPVGMDGSCNGQQWAAGFLRSRKLAENVNLVKSTRFDKPNDLYRSVADGMVKFLDRPITKIMADIEPAKKASTKKGKKNVKKSR